MVRNQLIRPYFWRGWHWDSHHEVVFVDSQLVIINFEVCFGCLDLQFLYPPVRPQHVFVSDQRQGPPRAAFEWHVERSLKVPTWHNVHLRFRLIVSFMFSSSNGKSWNIHKKKFRFGNSQREWSCPQRFSKVNIYVQIINEICSPNL